MLFSATWEIGEMETPTELKEVVIPPERAVFWMDRFGRWCNESGRFRHKKLIDYFNSSIRRDGHGYFVEQIRETVREKVYFLYEDTPLFVVDVSLGPPIDFLLNTGERLPLIPDRLFVHGDDLYMEREAERIKFTDRVLLKIAGLIDFDGRHYAISVDGRWHTLAER